MIHRLYAPLTERLGSDKPELRAGLAVSQIIGVGMGRYVLKFERLASAKSSEVHRLARDRPAGLSDR